jgi:hypothetical protein
MSWHYLQEQEAASWEGSCLDGAPSALLKLIPTPAASCSLDKQTGASNRSPFGMTLRRSTGTDGAEALTWFQGDSPARTYLPPEDAQESEANEAVSGLKWPGSLAKFNPALYGWRTPQCSLFEAWTWFSGTWPRWGMMRGGELFPLATPDFGMDANGSGLLPTPKASMDGISPKTLAMVLRGDAEMSLPRVLRMIGLTLQPSFAEWLMAWPADWTDCTQSATDKFRQWCDSHGAPSREGVK